MRVDWQQQLEGFRLIEIRDFLRRLRRNLPFSEKRLAQLISGRSIPNQAALDHASDLIAGLIASGLVERIEDPKRKGLLFDVTQSGISLCAASATKRITRERADRAIEALLKTVDRINADPIFMHDVEWVAVYGS